MNVLFYKAQTTGNMWDTWLYWHEGVFHLFYLAGPGGQWDGIATATSRDGIHWQEHGMVLKRAAGVTWLGTGSVWERPSGGTGRRFILNFSEWRGNAQTIFFAESDDLLEWRRLGSEYEFGPDERWYNAEGGEGGRWDCIYTIEGPGGGRYGYWTANPLGFVGFGFGQSVDGVTWTALPPPPIEWGHVRPLTTIESGAVALIGGRFYTMVGTNVEYPPYSSGMFCFSADLPTGPFRPTSPNFALLTSPVGRWHTYFARFLPVGDVLLVNHHAIAPDGEVYFAPLKEAVVDAAGVLRLKWWPGNDAVKSEWADVDEWRELAGSDCVAAPAATPEGTAAARDAADALRAADVVSVAGAVGVPQVAGAASHSDCTGNAEREERQRRLFYVPSAGALVEGRLAIPAGPLRRDECPPELSVACGQGHQATRFRMQSGGAVDIEEVGVDGSVQSLGTIDRALALVGTASVRLLLMHCFAELYLADYLIQVVSLPASPVGRVELNGIKGMSCRHGSPGRAG